jgi:hypothetical protein
MVPAPCEAMAPVPPPAYQRAQATRRPALHLDALTVVTRLHLLALCRLAVHLAHQRRPPPLPAGPGGRPRRYSDESLLLLALLRTLWRLSYQDLHDWLAAWPALAIACGLPRDAQGRPCVPSASQQCRRGAQAGAPPCETVLVVLVRLALHRRLISGRDLIVDSAPILAWRRRDPDAAVGHAPHHHARPLLWGYRVHTLLCRGSGLPLLCFVAPANGHDAPFAQPLLTWAVRLYGLRPRVVRLDAGYWGLRLIACTGGCGSSPGSTRPLAPSRSSPGTRSGRRTARSCRRPGPRTNWANGPASSASLGASSACSVSSACSAPHSPAGRPSLRASR